MGVSCEICLKAPSDGVFVAGSVVSGEIKYALDENTAFKRITMSLKGIGTTRLRKKLARKNNTRFSKARFVDDKKIIHDKVMNGNELTVNAGSYNVPFEFKIPEKVPPSISLFRKRVSYDLKYKVAYYICMKFERSGFLAFPKRYRKEINVVSNITHTLPREPLTFGEKKKLFNQFSGVDSVVNIKSTILDSVIKAGGTVNLEYEVANKSHVAVTSVETKLVETVIPKKHTYAVFEKDVPDTDSKTRSIKVGDTQQLLVSIKVPDTEFSIDSCKLVARNYSVKILVELPMPHTNFSLSIPIQVMLKENEDSTELDAPPSYWDVMCEDQEKEASTSK